MNFITNILNSLGWYPTVFILMLLESTVIPVPSEFVVTPAAYHAASGSLNVFLIILRSAQLQRGTGFSGKRNPADYSSFI